MLINNENYFHALENIKEQIKSAQYRAILGVNREQIILFWNIGKVIIANTKYGAKFIDNLARDIKVDFSNAKGYSVCNLKYMRKFAEFVDSKEKVQTLSALLSWSHNKLLPSPQNGLATNTLKDPYVFDFIEQREGIIEREIENELVANIAKTLIELGTGFAFIGNQYHLSVGNGVCRYTAISRRYRKTNYE